MLTLFAKFMTALGVVVILFFLSLVAWGSCMERQRLTEQTE